MKGLQDSGLEFIWASCLMGVQAFEQFFNALSRDYIDSAIHLLPNSKVAIFCGCTAWIISQRRVLLRCCSYCIRCCIAWLNTYTVFLILILSLC